MVFSFRIMVIASAAFVTWALDSTILLDLSASRQLLTVFITGLCEKLLHICIFFIISFLMAVYLFVFQNIVIKKRSFYIFTIFRDSQLVFAPLKKTIIFRILCFRISDLYCQLTNYSWATILFWLSLPNGSINYFLMKRKISIFWNIVINFCSFLTLRWEWHQALIKKCRNLLLLISFPTQSPLDRMIDQSLLDFLGITPFEERLWSWKCRYIFLHLTHDIFHLCDSWHHFVECFLQRWCCRHKQRFRGYLCDLPAADLLPH